jgi:hypothetical protein
MGRKILSAGIGAATITLTGCPGVTVTAPCETCDHGPAPGIVVAMMYDAGEWDGGNDAGLSFGGIVVTSMDGGEDGG